MSALNKRQKFLQLADSERWSLTLAFLMLPLTALGLRWFGFKRCRSVLGWLAPLQKTSGRVSPEISVRQALATAGMVRTAGRHGLYHASCLQESLVLWYFLRRQGMEPHLCIGVRKETNQIEAHAWVEWLGVAVNDSPEVRCRFKAFERIF